MSYQDKSNDEYYKKYLKYKIKYTNLKLQLKGGDWTRMENSNDAFTSYKSTNNPAAGAYHCTIYHKSGDVHCKNGSNKVCGTFSGVYKNTDKKACDLLKNFKEQFGLN
jgi:hypothetical protein